MEIRMTVHVPRRRPRPVDVVVTARPGSTVAELRPALADHLGAPVGALVVAGSAVADGLAVGSPPLLDGVSVAVTAAATPDADGAGARPRPVLSVVCVGGPDAGRSHPLAPPGLDVGRGPRLGLRLDDPSLSRTHARFSVGPGGVVLEDLGSTNGVLVDGHSLDRPTPVDTASTVVIGASTLRLRRTPGAGTPVGHPGDGTVRVTAAASRDHELPAVRVEVPAPPPEPHRARIPWVAALVPVPVAVVLALFLGPYLLAFAVLGPLALLGTAAGDRVGSRRRHRRALAEHAEARATARARFDDAVAAECVGRHLAHPDPDDVLRCAEGRLPGLWSAPDDLVVRLGLGDIPSATTLVDGREPRTGTARHVPVTLDLVATGCLGVVGPPDATTGVVAAVLGQLVAGHPPSRVTVDPGPGPEQSWLRWAPHRGGRGTRVRVGAAGGPAGDDVAGEEVTVVVSPDRSALPGRCGAVLEAVGGGRWLLHEPSGSTPLVADAVGPAWCDRLGRALVPLREPDAAAGGLPDAVGLGDLGVLPADAAALLARWRTSGPPRAVVGSTAGGPFVVDLERDGPHVLVGGTTGSGKSEFLRTLVTALALESPPEALALLLVDFKGGAAFGPCADLPHVVGVVTDLDEHLVGRVLRSLRAEIRRRERRLAEVGASDLAAYRSRDVPEPLPRLVVVVDELRALVDELPEFVPGLVRLAAQGRSLGIHLVLATQRPSGSIGPEVQANVDLRIAFRVRDRADSVGVVEHAAAAEIPADRPGRALARGGDGDLTSFQTALVRPRTAGPPVTVRAAEDGRGPAADAPPPDRAAETAQVVRVVRDAHDLGGRSAPRRPWLPALPPRIAVADLPAGAYGLVDDPDAQRRDPARPTTGVTLHRVVGPPGSGRTGTCRALVSALTATTSPAGLHVQVLGAPGLADLAGLPQVGTVASLEDRAAVRALVDHLEGGPPVVRTLLVVDGWERLADLDDPRDPVPLTERVLRLLRDGLPAVVSGGRDLLRSSWSALGGEVLLASGDPVDATLLGLPTASLPRPRAGLVVRAGDAREIQVAHVTAEDLVRAARSAPRTEDGAAGPWCYRPLPTLAPRPGPAALGGSSTSGLLLGLTAPTRDPWAWEPARDGRRLLVAGPAGSGRSTALDALARSATERGRPVVVVRDRPDTDLGCPPAGWPVLGPDAVDGLVALRRAHPDLLVLVDDADRLGDAPVAPLLAEIAGLVDRDRGAVAVATTTAGLRGRFRGLDVEVARHRTGVLLRPGPDDGEVLGVRRLPVDDDRPPVGRGVVVVDGAVRALQVLAPESAVDVVGAG